MTMAWSSSDSTMAPCSLCGLTVLCAEVRTLTAGKRYARWQPRRHAGPCGRPCMGGGVGSEFLRACREAKTKWADQVHGANCGACNLRAAMEAMP